MIKNDQNGFWIAPFGADGNAEGLGFWDFSKLSARWLQFFGGVFRANPSSFDCSLTDNLSHVGVKLTSVSGAALVTISYSRRIASSLLLLIGGAPEKDREPVRMFVESLKRTTIVKASGSDNPFGKLFEIEERPLVAVVPWPSEAVDHDLVKEIGLHLAGAFILQNGRWKGQKSQS